MCTQTSLGYQKHAEPAQAAVRSMECTFSGTATRQAMPNKDKEV